ncbi:MAG: PAS domain S-box protein [Verrucomicrobia bacterium]|nr:PAS domain S-box protein [Verrucomicrobiota bacterium]MCH8514048.1 PAS domain S-box protein [Kiritimatiellia bacterium]
MKNNKDAPFTTTLLHQAADPFRLLVESVKDYAIYLLDPEGTVVSWNSGAERCNGYTAVEMLGQPFGQLFTAEDVASGKPRDVMDAALADGRCEVESMRTRKDGSHFLAILTVTALREYDRDVGFAVITRDITERRRVEEALGASEARFRLLVDSIDDYAIFMLDINGTVQT